MPSLRRDFAVELDGKKPVDSKMTSPAFGMAGIGQTIGLACWGADGIPLGTGIEASVGTAAAAGPHRTMFERPDDFAAYTVDVVLADSSSR